MIPIGRKPDEPAPSDPAPGFRAVASLGDPGSIVAAGVAAAVKRYGADIVNSVWDGIANALGFDDCADDRKLIYRWIVNAMPPEELAQQFMEGRIAGFDAKGTHRTATGNCLKYSLRYAAKRLVDLSNASKIPAKTKDPVADLQRQLDALKRRRDIEAHAARMVLREMGIEWRQVAHWLPLSTATQEIPRIDGESADDEALRTFGALAGLITMVRASMEPLQPPAKDEGTGLGATLLGGLFGFAAGRASKRDRR